LTLNAWLGFDAYRLRNLMSLALLVGLPTEWTVYLPLQGHICASQLPSFCGCYFLFSFLLWVKRNPSTIILVWFQETKANTFNPSCSHSHFSPLQYSFYAEGSHYTARLASLSSSCLNLPSARITGVSHHAYFSLTDTDQLTPPLTFMVSVRGHLSTYISLSVFVALDAEGFFFSWWHWSLNSQLHTC
jgi:hypothetical protein